MTKERELPEYVEEAIAFFNDLMTQNQQNAMDNLNKMSKGEHFVLQYLVMKNKQINPSELSDALQSSTARISALLGALERKGQIHREVDQSDRRNILVTITKAGRQRIEAVIKKLNGLTAQIFMAMGEKDTKEFLRLSKLFSAKFQKIVAEKHDDLADI